jgi:hypothetical protein
VRQVNAHTGVPASAGVCCRRAGGRVWARLNQAVCPCGAGVQQRAVHVLLAAVAPYAMLALARRAPAPGATTHTPLGWIAWAYAAVQSAAAPAHLTLFYLFGVYYYASHRVVGVRYVCVRTHTERERGGEGHASLSACLRCVVGGLDESRDHD